MEALTASRLWNTVCSKTSHHLRLKTYLFIMYFISVLFCVMNLNVSFAASLDVSINNVALGRHTTLHCYTALKLYFFTR